ncbi:hypothetical protein GCM10009618_23570 [Nesterenkonia lacusekhoensis]
MSCWHCILWESIEQMRGTLCQLRVQVVTFKGQLTTGDTHLRHGAEGSTRVISHQLRRGGRMGDACGIEPIASTLRFRMKLRQIRPDRWSRLGMLPEPFQLWVSGVPACAAQQNCLREERLPPARDEPLAVQQGRVERPQAHAQIIPVPSSSRMVSAAPTA